MATRTIGSRLDENGGLGPGFDFLRVALAIGVVLWHQPEIMFGQAGKHGFVMAMLGPILLPMFFALSGFLISGSALRLGLGQFLINRGLRIFPALVVEVILCAFVLGPLFTSLPLHAYFLDKETYHYLTNAVGVINFALPGVFSANPSTTVNWSIWTVPCELGCYAVMALMIILKIIKRPRHLLLFSLSILPTLYVAQRFLVRIDALPASVRPTAFYLTTSGIGLLIPFLLGVICHAYRYRIPFHWGLALFALVPVAALTVLHDPTRYPPLFICLLLAETYLCAFIGVLRIPPLPLFRNGDYSYGIYLYGAPVQQAVRAALPGLQNGSAYLAIALAAIVAFAMLSWHGLEKPILGLRKRFSFVARARGLSRGEDSAVNAPPPVVSRATGQILTYGTRRETAPPGPAREDAR
jgi:peptidoglycan/LPS O-acetylase OafA/YrhL